MIHLLLALTFVMWVLIDAQVLAWARDPITEWVDARSGYLGYVLSCRACAGFWVSLAYLRPSDEAAWIELLALNGAHVLVVAAHALAGLVTQQMKESQAMSQPVYVPEPDASMFLTFFNSAPTPARAVMVDLLDHMHSTDPTMTFGDLHQALEVK